MAEHESEIGVAMDVRVGLRVATVGSRALAQLIDLFIVQILQLIAVGCGLGVAVAVSDTTENIGWIVGIVTLIATLVAAAWFIGYEIAWDGQTPGKRWVGLRVVTEDGRIPDAGAIVLRNAMRLVDFLPGAYLVGVVSMLASSRGRRLGDIVAGTLVIAEERAVGRSRRWPEGIADAEVRVLEAYFARGPSLEPERREELAARLLERMGRTCIAGCSAAVTLESLCPEVA